MKNEKIIQALNKASPSDKQKENMLRQVLNHDGTKSFSWNHFWKVGICVICICCFLTTKSMYEENKGVVPALIEPRALIKEQNNLEFCYQNICYQEIGMASEEMAQVFLETVFEPYMNTEINVYQGENEKEKILQIDNSYFLYQQIEN